MTERSNRTTTETPKYVAISAVSLIGSLILSGIVCSYFIVLWCFYDIVRLERVFRLSFQAVVI